jgi:RimJ/RimL family protein N-acetyltransferase/GNAT superfamily N-acetyltransferase
VSDLQAWTPRPRPGRTVLEGRFVRLEPLDPARHGDTLFEAVSGPEAEALHRYLPERPPADRTAFQPWLDRAAASEDPLYSAAVDPRTGRGEGRLTFLRIEPAHGVVETGHILFGPRLARTPAATEAIYLQARHAFGDLGYRRFEWKCNDRNEPSKRAAVRFGFSFEGLFRQHMVVKGENRDTAWFAMLDRDWPARRRTFERWLDPANFDEAGRQRLSLTTLNADGIPGSGLRLAGPDDLDALGHLQRTAFAENRALLGAEPLPLIFDYAQALGTYETWLMEEGAEPVGALMLDPRSDHLHLWSLATHPKVRRSGLGARLLEAAEVRARALGLSQLRLVTGEKLTGNVRWYHRHGYVIEGVEELADRRLVRMRKVIG